MAMKEALRHSSPVLLEPIVSVQVIVPKDLASSVIGDLKSRGADITGMEGDAEERLVRAIARLSDVIGLASDLNYITQDRGSYFLELFRYRPVQDFPAAGDDHIGVTANKPWKPKPRRGAVAVEPPWSESSSA